ncbi:MAG: SMP-30/gluconolactonase/LRE family protein [Bdellovibrionales bacterium]|nr:SMP-30/gluconolactonase/LRE family protein [Bdellovibrionales bacterium]
MKKSAIFFALLIGSGAVRAELYRSSPFTKAEFSEGIEGPAVGPDGTLYVVNYRRSGTIGSVDGSGKCRLFAELPRGSVGNGIRFNASGDMLVADYKAHNLLRYNFGAKAWSVFAHSDQFHQPNDLAVTTDGFFYASDPNWKNNTGQLWLVDPQGRAQLLFGDMGTTNGIEVSPDDRYLYVGESAQRRIWRFDIQKDRRLVNKVLFHEFKDFGLDGMRVDLRGRLFVARYDKGTVDILSPQGKLLREVVLSGKAPTNLTFGGKDNRTVFVTLQDKRYVESFETEFAGRR